MTRFRGMPQFEWIEEMQIRLEDTFKLKGNIQSSVLFEQNPYLKGLNYFSVIFNAIQNEVVLKINYQSYRQDKSQQLTIHPWFMKQFNNRWFLFGFNENFKDITNCALDRILGIEELGIKYYKKDDIDFEEYFDDVVGVTVKHDAPVEKILIIVSKEIWPYIESKPLHGSQKLNRKSDIDVIIELNVQINHELISMLFSYMDAIEVIEPKSLRERFESIIEMLYKTYS